MSARFLNFHCAIPAAEINRLQAIQQQGGATMLALNHSSLADSFSIQALAYQARLTPVTMAALKNFDRKIANIPYQIIWPIARRLGYFSVNRGNQSIQKSTDHVQEILGKGKNPLLIFPEGRISWQNNQVGACQTGALRLALQTSQNKGQTVRILPVGIGYRYLPQAKGQVLKLLTQNEKKCFKGQPPQYLPTD
ncbi:lysophospholipid acyltransferase family protein [Vampirovibrio chlorellavorus]|uniref:lysophospholipid acyltransferase family protein n=1 Tax=Vampirovibrio chlorellavorus TaxID=758823 RepID=UPI0026F28D0A|nr:1-acyl-sn-glycerol-3-phosphate acyltransferase [Vampirovibrio chlorellavorus]